MITLRWLLINPLLIPSYLCMAIGALLIILSAIFFQIRTRQIVVFFTIRRIAENFSKLEKRMLIIAAVLEVLGFISQIIVSEVIGYKTL